MFVSIYSGESLFLGEIVSCGRDKIQDWELSRNSGIAHQGIASTSFIRVC